MAESDYDVAVCGYGPTGIAAASLLARKGHRVWACDRWPTLYGHPRMATIDGEGARIVQNAGDADDAFRHSIPRPRYIQANAAGQILIDHDWDRPQLCGFPFRLSLHQPDIESAMDARARDCGAVIDQGWEVIGLEQDAAQVRVSVQARGPNGARGATRTVSAKFLIAADGARSPIREALGVKRESWPFRDAWLSYDATRKRDLPNLLGVSPNGEVAAIFCAPHGGSHSIIPLGLRHLRFNFRIDPDTPHDGTLNREASYRRIGAVYGLTEDDVEVYREALYPFEGKLADRWRVGRVFLAGDAAHLMTPFYGQGGCSGLRDSINLAWKLDLVLSGAAPDGLLDSYAAERIPNVRVHIGNSDRLGALIFLDDPEAAAARDRRLLSGEGEAPQPEPVLDGPLVDATSGDPAGRLAPQGMVRFRGRRARLDDIAGFGFQLIARDRAAVDALGPSERAFLDRIGACLVVMDAGAGADSAEDEEGVYAAMFAEHDLCAYLARPDFIVFGAARRPGDLPALIARLRSALTGV